MSSKKKTSKRRAARVAQPSSDRPQSPESAPAPTLEEQGDPQQFFMLLIPILIGGLWAFYPTLRELAAVWNREPDYSHGWLVAPIAIGLLVARRDRFPGLSPAFSWIGLLLIGISIAIRYTGWVMFLSPLDGWAMLVWLGGVVLCLGGWRLFVWAAPSLGFLLFMVPLPFRAEGMLSYPLQRVATKISCWAFQFLGQPALPEGNTIHLGDHVLEVEQACSGLRIFVGIAAIACVYIIAFRRPLWQKALLVLSVLPIALVANATRIVVTGLLYQYASSGAAMKFSHDFAGIVMIPFAACLFALFLWYVGWLFPLEEQVRMSSIIRPGSASTST